MANLTGDLPPDYDRAVSGDEEGDEDYEGEGGGAEEHTVNSDTTEEDPPPKRQQGSSAEKAHELLDPRLFHVGKYFKGKDNPNLAHISKILATVGQEWEQAGLRSEHETY